MTTKKTPTQRFLNPKFIDSLLKYAFAAFLIFVPLYPKFPLFNVPGTYVAIRAEDFIIAIMAVLLLFKFSDLKKYFRSSNTAKAILIYLLVALLSALSGIWVTKTSSTLLTFLHWARRVEYLTPFFAGVILMKDKDNLKFFLKLLPLVAFGVFAYGIAQIFFEAPVIITQNEEYSKGIALTLQPGVNLASTFAGHYDLATYLVMTLSIFTALTFYFKNKAVKLLSVILLVLLFWIQLRTGSRIALLALVSSIGLVLVILKRPFWILPMLIVIMIGVANTPSIAGRFERLVQVLKFQYLEEKVKGVFDSRTSFIITPIYAQEDEPIEPLRPIQQDRSTSIRFDVEWPRALRALAKNPFLGTGYSSISLSTDNDYLRSLGETGLLGFFAWLSILVNIIAELIKKTKRKLTNLQNKYVIGTLGAVVGFLIIATFIDVFEASKVATLFWGYTGLATGIKGSKK